MPVTTIPRLPGAWTARTETPTFTKATPTARPAIVVPRRPIEITRPSVEDPKRLETVIARLPDGKLWKYSRYFDSPQYWTEPGNQDVFVEQTDPTPAPPKYDVSLACTVTVKATPVPEEHELYDLTHDPMELSNKYDAPAYSAQRAAMVQILAEQRAMKRLSPTGVAQAE